MASVPTCPFWTLPIDLTTAQRIRTKYETIGEMYDKPALEHRARWQSLTQRFPGAMREADMCHPNTLRARMQFTQTLERHIGQPRGSVVGRDAQAVILWDELHIMIEDILRYRRSGQDTTFARWTQTRTDPALERRWTHDVGGSERVDVKRAYEVMATRVQLARPELMDLLFDRWR